MELIIDDRESKVVPYFNSSELFTKSDDITFKVDRCNIGDYCISFNKEIVIIIERKSWKDLASSIRDGRKENVNIKLQ